MQSVYKKPDMLISFISLHSFPRSIFLKNSKMVHAALMLSQNASLIFFQYEIIREKSKKPQIMQTFPLWLKNLAAYKNCHQ